MYPFALLLRPPAALRMRWLAAATLPLLALSALLVVLAAMAMPEGYSWRFHSISESAAQGQLHGWIARLAFLAFGTAVFCLTVAMRRCWARMTCWMNTVFAVFMIGAAAFSHTPWLPNVPSDPFEDLLHSICASGMGFAFCIGVVARLMQRGPGALFGKGLDVFALVVATALPMMMASSSDESGLAQRVMFAIAYIWFGHEALIALTVTRRQDDAAAVPVVNGEEGC